MAFLRQVVHLRARLVDYFVTGEMARPPALPDVPAVTADWQLNEMAFMNYVLAEMGRGWARGKKKRTAKGRIRG